MVYVPSPTDRGHGLEQETIHILDAVAHHRGGLATLSSNSGVTFAQMNDVLEIEKSDDADNAEGGPDVHWL
eukprot:2428980-Karenia_brevis.AAC.1